MINIDFYTDYKDKIKIEKYNKFLEEYKEKINNIVEDALILNNVNIEKVYLGIGIVTPEEINRLNRKCNCMQHVILFYRNRFNNAFIPKHYYIQDCAIFPKFVTLDRFHSSVEMFLILLGNIH